MPTQTTLWRPAALDALLGAWTFEITQEGQTVVRGRTEFARVEGGAFLLQHATAELLPATPQVWRENSPFPVVTVMGVDARWERSEEDRSWQRDFDIRYTKARSP